jgi:magnesium transporter
MERLELNHTVDQIRQSLDQGRSEEVRAILTALLPADKASLFEALNPEMQQQLLSMVDPADVADILEELDYDDAATVAEQLDATTLTQAMDEMEPDEAADLLGDLSTDLRRETLAGMATQEDVRPLLGYADDSAGGLMTSRYFVFSDQAPVREVLGSIRAQPAHGEEIPYVYAIDDAGVLTGVTRLADLIRAHPDEPFEFIMNRAVVSIRDTEDQEIAARLVNRYDLLAIPVVDGRDRLVGIITADDAMDILERETSEDIYRSVGILSFEGQEAARSDLLVSGPVWRIWLVRVPFLLIALVGGMLAGSVIGIYEEALEAVTVLAFFIPVVMGMGGNAGIQSTTVFIRAHALGQIDTAQIGKHILRELVIGLSMGAILGVLAGLIAFIWQGIPNLGLVVGLSLACTMALAAVLGFIIPYILIKVGVDPAAGADPIITTIKDLTGLFIYFFFAFEFLGHLL